MCDDDNLLTVISDRPRTPEEDNCCGNACNPCIFDLHKKLLEQWTKNKNTINNVKRKNLLAPTQYKVFNVVDVEKINDEYVMINLQYAEKKDNELVIFLNPGQHVIINIMSWSKPFTPISWTDNSLKLLVRIYENGVNTNKLRNIDKGEEIKIRGPYGNFHYTRNSFNKIIMFCIGSGIAAFYPIVKTIIDDDLEETRIYLIAGFRTIDYVPLRKELQLLTDFWNFDCTLYISQQTGT